MRAERDARMMNDLMTGGELSASAASATQPQTGLPRSHAELRDLGWALLALSSAGPLALAMREVNEAFTGEPATARLAIAGLCALWLAVPVLLFVRRRRLDASAFATIMLAIAALLLTAVYLYRASFQVLFPADILIWSESDFVNDIVKLRRGYPLYSAQANNDSFFYPPGAQVLTYSLAWLAGRETSIPVFRMIQLGYTLLAAILALACTRMLVVLSRPDEPPPGLRVWGIAWLPLLLLFATNFLTNPFVFNLHNDALAQLLSLTTYWLLLRYVSSRDGRLLVALAILPALGFLVKQSVVIWAPLCVVHLMVFDRPRSLRRCVTFAAAACAAVGVVALGCYLLWGDEFVYWLFAALRRHTVSPLRSAHHAVRLWAYFAIAIFGGLVLLRGRSAALLLGPWCIGFALLLIEVYTSGIAWMMNHAGPGCLIAGVWFSAALVHAWPGMFGKSVQPARARRWRAAAAVAAGILLCKALGVVRPTTPPFAADAYRYVAEIEREFAGHAADRILLDMGSWVYLKDGVVMKDRAPSIGERGYSGSGDFSAMLRRLETKQYAKILVRNLQSPDFWYDHALWSTPSGIRRALLEHYHETGRIEAVSSPSGVLRPYGFGAITILEPTVGENDWLPVNRADDRRS